MLRVLLIAAAVAVAAAQPADARGCDGGRLLPTIVAFTPSGVQVDEIDVDGATTAVLTFGTGLGNVGRGPLELLGRRATRANPVMRATQVIHCARGPVMRRGDIGGMRYARVPTHFHWHLRDLERYRLVSLDSGRVFYTGKRGFCLGDAYDLGLALARHPVERQFAGDLATACAKNRPRARSVRLGLSVGWGDSYPEIIEGQFVDLRGVPAGTYRLLMETDPFERIVMGSRARVTAGVDLVLSRPDGETGTPVVELLGECLTAEECASPDPTLRSAPDGLSALGRAPQGFAALTTG